MPCDYIGGAIVCTRRRVRCHWCPRSATLLCDWKIATGKTCDAPLCATHGEPVVPGKHLCPDHQVTYKNWLAGRAIYPVKTG